MWWVPYTLRRTDRIIDGVNSGVKRTTHKYGIELLRSVDEALRFGKLNGSTLWRDAINKEIENLKAAFDIKPEDSRPRQLYPFQRSPTIRCSNDA